MDEALLRSLARYRALDDALVLQGRRSVPVRLEPTLGESLSEETAAVMLARAVQRMERAQGLDEEDEILGVIGRAQWFERREDDAVVFALGPRFIRVEAARVSWRDYGSSDEQPLSSTHCFEIVACWPCHPSAAGVSFSPVGIRPGKETLPFSASRHLVARLNAVLVELRSRTSAPYR